LFRSRLRGGGGGGDGVDGWVGMLTSCDGAAIAEMSQETPAIELSISDESHKRRVWRTEGRDREDHTRINGRAVASRAAYDGDRGAAAAAADRAKKRGRRGVEV